jgi:pimeloyl-ACP methyl ester carboxylesterase
MSMLTSAPQAFTDMKAVCKYYRENNAQMLAHRSDEDVLEYARWHVRKNDVSVYTWKMDPAVRTPQPQPSPPPDLWAAFKNISCPILVVRGAQSDVLAPEVAQKMLEARPGAKIVEVAGAGHAPALTEPELHPVLDEFLATT